MNYSLVEVDKLWILLAACFHILIGPGNLSRVPFAYLLTQDSYAIKFLLGFSDSHIYPGQLPLISLIVILCYHSTCRWYSSRWVANRECHNLLNIIGDSY